MSISSYRSFKCKAFWLPADANTGQTTFFMILILFAISYQDQPGLRTYTHVQSAPRRERTSRRTLAQDRFKLNQKLVFWIYQRGKRIFLLGLGAFLRSPTVPCFAAAKKNEVALPFARLGRTQPVYLQ
jgi:hypothetical protein